MSDLTLSHTNIEYNSVVSFKKNCSIIDSIINKLNIINNNIKNINLKNINIIKTKKYNSFNNLSIEKQIISLLNLLTESNKVDICNKILSVSVKSSDIELLISNIHKKCCTESHFLDTYIYIIKRMILSGLYNFNQNQFWVTLVNKIQETFNMILDTKSVNNDIYCGNIIFIFYLCREQLLSLSIINIVYNRIINMVEDNEIVINIIFSIVEKIPLNNKYN